MNQKEPRPYPSPMEIIQWNESKELEVFGEFKIPRSETHTDLLVDLVHTRIKSITILEESVLIEIDGYTPPVDLPGSKAERASFRFAFPKRYYTVFAQMMRDPPYSAEAHEALVAERGYYLRRCRE